MAIWALQGFSTHSSSLHQTQTKINRHGYLIDTTKTCVTDYVELLNTCSLQGDAQADKRNNVVHKKKTHLIDGCVISSELHFCNSFINAIILAFDTNKLLDASSAFFPCLHA